MTDLTPKSKTSPAGGGWFKSLSDNAASLSARALAATSSAAKRVSEATRSFSARGSTTRAQPIDEASPDWRQRAGRAAGPNTYVHGDLCAATFRRALALSPRERELLYCGAVLLVGILEADGLPCTEKGASPSPYASLSLEDTLGYDVRAEHQLTRTIPGTRAPQWDEVFAVGQRVESLDDIARVRLTVKSYSGALGGSEKLGMAHLRLDELMETEAEGGAWTEKWVPLQMDVGNGSSRAVGGGGGGGSGGGGGGGGSGACGRLRILYLFHRPPSTPQPVSLGVMVVSAHALAGGEAGHGHYITVAALNRLKARVRGGEGEAPMRPLRGASVRDGGSAPAFAGDVFELHDAASGGVSGDVSGGAAGPWGWAGGRPRALLASCAVRPAEVALADSATEVQVSVWEEGVLSACVGEVCVPFASLWGHEDAVAHGATLRIARWYRLSPPRGLLEGVTGKGGASGGEAGAATGGRRTPGRVFLDVVLRFGAPLLPPGWVEAVCTESGDAYFYHEALRVAQWEPPAWPCEEGSAAGGGSARERGASAVTAAALLREGARTRGSSASWAADGGVMGSSASASSDVVAGDSPHKPPRPRALRVGALAGGGGSGAEARVRALDSLSGGAAPRAAAGAGGEGAGEGEEDPAAWPRPPPPAQAPQAKLAVNPFNMRISPLAGTRKWGAGAAAAASGAAAAASALMGAGSAAPSGSNLPTLAEVPAYLASAAASRGAGGEEGAAPAKMTAAPPISSPPPRPPVSSPPPPLMSSPPPRPPPQQPQPQPQPPPAPPAKRGGDSDQEEDDSDGDGSPPAGPSAAELDAAAAGGSKGAAARAEAALLAVPEFNNPLAGMPRPAGGAGGHREGDFFKALAKNAAEKKAAQEAEKAVRGCGAPTLRTRTQHTTNHPPPHTHTPLLCAGENCEHDAGGAGGAPAGGGGGAEARGPAAAHAESAAGVVRRGDGAARGRAGARAGRRQGRGRRRQVGRADGPRNAKGPL
jgi:hypothetical protein